jgi:hypothetical protein
MFDIFVSSLQKKNQMYKYITTDEHLATFYNCPFRFYMKSKSTYGIIPWICDDVKTLYERT